MLPTRKLNDWNLLSQEAQLWIAHEAMQRAFQTVAGHAELLANEMEAGDVGDHGGPEALRLLASMVRLTGGNRSVPVGHA